jgi:lipid-A-disaccharide synthase-like uncharacterized protein
MSAPVSKLPFVLLGLMTLATFTGPFLIRFTIRGGRSPAWPPDRPAEWWVFGLVTGAVAVLMIACLAVGYWNKKRSIPQDRSRKAEQR